MSAARPRRVLGPAVAGTWYPAEAAELEREIEQLLSGAPEGRAPLALVVPHAGLPYSGPTAGRAFARLAGLPIRRVVLIGPSHRAAFHGACLPEAEQYRTPLDDVPLDRESIDELKRREGFLEDDRPFLGEHCLEIELPFLQRALAGTFALLPLLVGAGTPSSALERIAAALRAFVHGADTVFVVSSDFTHYGPRFGFVPFEDDVPRRIRELDMGAIEHIVRLDRDGFRNYVAETGATICGHSAIELLLGLLPVGARGELVAYDTSARVTGDDRHSVSYASLAFSP